MEKAVLHLGCGRTYIKNAVNVDFFETKCCDQVVDLNKFPWPWEDNSIDEVYMLYFIEHFDSAQVINIFKEIHRILKVNGLLHVQCPHFTSMIALTDLDHKKSFSFTSFGILEGNNFTYSEPLFKKEMVKINILLTLPSENKYIDFDFEKTSPNIGARPIMRKLLWPFKFIFQFFIDLSPTLFERFWCYWIGGADEIIYRGRKA